MKLAGFCLVLALAAAAAPMTLAAEAPQVALAQCELHVWPGEGLAMMRAGAWDNFKAGSNGKLIDSLTDSILPEKMTKDHQLKDGFDPNAKRPDQVDILKRDRQIALMQSLPLEVAMHRPGYRVVYHDKAEGLAAARSAAKLSDSKATCYSELLFTDLTYARVYANGHNLKAFIVLREFDANGSLTRRSGLPVETKLKVPTKAEDRTAEAFGLDLDRAFLANINLFASQIASSPKSGK